MSTGERNRARGSDGPRTPPGDGLVLALDIGTSSCRARLYDGRARWVPDCGSHILYTPRFTEDGGAELDPDQLLEQVAASIDHLASQAGSAVNRITAVAISTFWHSLMGVDDSGQPVTPLYLWEDSRSRDDAAALRERLDEREVHERTGCVLHWSYLPAKLLWLYRTETAAFRTVRRWLSFGEYLAFRFFGRGGVSVSMASGTGLFNQHTLDWDGSVLGALPIDPDQLSPLISLTEPFSGLQQEVSSRWQFLRSVPWLPALGDGACSNLGAGCVTRERLCTMVGTSAVMRVLWEVEDLKIPPGLWCYRLDRRRAVMGGAMDDGGNVLEWLRDSLKLPGFKDLEKAVASIEPDSHGLTVLPLWAGERSPNWSLDATGAIAGLHLGTSPVEIVRAVMEAVAIRFAEVQAIIHGAIPEAREVVASGGALLHSPTWMQIMADALGRPVIVSPELEASSRGAVLMALELLGALPGGIETTATRGRRVFEPVPEHTERYKTAGERQRRLYEKLIGSRK